LNAAWRDRDKATNVLSFPLAETADFENANVAGAELLLGDIVLARGVCEAEAADKGISVEDHATHLVVHGTLHLLGYDHHDDGEAADMEAREVRALSRLGIANPYEEAA
jgi:probable rRNA maturation factor